VTVRDLVQIIGPDAARALAQHSGGGRIYVPTLEALARAHVSSQIGRAQVEDGLTAEAAAERYGCSHSTAKRARAAYLAKIS
jgi:hypothetical protein